MLNNNQEFIIWFDTASLWKGLGVLFCFFLLLTFLFSLTSSVSQTLLGSGLFFVVQTILIFFMSLFGFACLYTFVLLKHTTPLAILHEEGIWVMHFGFIPWDEVASIQSYAFLNSPHMVAIFVHNINWLWHQAPWGGKVRLFWSKLCKTPPITFANGVISPQEIVERAHDFMKLNQEKIKT